MKKTAIIIPARYGSSRLEGKPLLKVNNKPIIQWVYETAKTVETCDEVIVATHEGKCIRFSEHDVRAMGRDTQGVKCMDLAENDYLVDMIVLKPDYQVVTISELGYGKRSPQSEYRLQLRAGKGVKAGVFNEKTGKLAGLKQVRDDNDLMLISDNGTIIRIHADDISVFGRDTLGVRVMRMQENEKIVSVAVSPKEDDEETLEQPEQNEQLEQVEQ